MQLKHCFYMFLFLFITLSSCATGLSTPGSTLQPPAFPTATIFSTVPSTQGLSPSVTVTRPTPIPTLTSTPALPATLNPQAAAEFLKALLREPGDCLAPCFWGIVPGQTTLDEATNIFTHLGLQMQFTNARDNKEFYEVIYVLESGLSVSPLLTIQDGRVKNLRVYISPEESQPGIPRAWQAYSPEILIARYGLPTKVAFSVDRPRDADAEPKAWYWMFIYFENFDLIIQYGYPEIAPPLALLQICPLADHYDNVRIWLGKNPESPPLGGIPIEEAATLTIEDFSSLMTGIPENACFKLKGDLFP